MTKDDMEIVSALQIALADKVGQERFELWFGANTRLEVSDGALTVRVPNQFFQDWLRKNYRQQIEAACQETLGWPAPVNFRVDPSLAEAVAAAASPGPQASQVKDSLAGVSAAPAPPAPAGAARRRFAALDSFVVGSTNRLARVAVQTMVSGHGATSPLLLYGPTGVGKTHLLEALWTEARKTRAGCQAVYLSAEQFTTQFLGALHGSGLPSFRSKHRGLDLLLIDDLQFLAGKRATLVELLHTIDAFARAGRQLAFAADRPPAELGELGPELVTRLQGGLVCGIQPPEYETRLGIVGRMAARFELAVPGDVQAYVAAHFTSHARELAGALNRLHATSLALERPITLELAEEALAEVLQQNSRSVRLADIEQAVCQVFGLEPQSLQSRRKGKQVSHPRMLAMWLARKHTRAALSEIGCYFGGRSHTTVISAQKKINAWMAGRASLDVSHGQCDVEEAVRRIEQTLQAG
ncbi:MAG TPA: chromosomal replication initiator protein DnaA [Pirellulales bacterium]|nr:chromosomal replication initiator protein DnaA [Pirellulales bacterium]